jgi:glycosyltransferase involved in cell wall biosynthesis
MDQRTDCRILFLVGQLGIGGLERQLYYLLEGMNRTRYRPAVVGWNSRSSDGYGPKIQSLGVPVYCFGEKVSPAAKLASLRRMAKNLRPEVVHSFSFYTNYAAYFAALNRPVLALGSLRSDIVADQKRVGLMLGVLSGRWPREQVANNISTTESIRTLQSWSAPKRVHLVRNGIDLEKFQDHGFTNRHPTHIVGVGSLLPGKRWDRVLRAVRELKSRGHACRVHIAGTGPLLESLRQEAILLNVSEDITFLGHVQDIPKLISEAMFLVHTSDIEGCPNAVMEAMACGRPVVATDAGDVPYLVNHGRTGFVVGRGDEEALVDRMATLIESPELCQSMGQEGRARAEQEFGMNRYVDAMMAAYRAAGWKG